MKSLKRFVAIGGHRHDIVLDTGIPPGYYGGIPPGRRDQFLIRTMPSQHKHRLMRPHSRLVEQIPGEYPESVNVALDRYLRLVSVPPQFSTKEWNLLRDACNGWATQNEPPEILKDGLALQVENAMTLSGLAKKWKVDQPTFRQKIESLTELEAISVIHAIEKFWSS